MAEVEKGRIGSSFDSFLEKEGIREEVEAEVLKEVIAWQIEQAMKARRLTINSHGPTNGDQPGVGGSVARSGEHVGRAAHVAAGSSGGGEAPAAGANIAMLAGAKKQLLLAAFNVRTMEAAYSSLETVL